MKIQWMVVLNAMNMQWNVIVKMHWIFFIVYSQHCEKISLLYDHWVFIQCFKYFSWYKTFSFMFHWVTPMKFYFFLIFSLTKFPVVCGAIFTISYHRLHDFTIVYLPSMLGRHVCLPLLLHEVKLVSFGRGSLIWQRCGQTLSMLTGAYQLEQ